MKTLISDAELTAYAEGLLSDEESRELEQRALRTGQADLLLSVIIAQNAIDKQLAEELWGADELAFLWEAKPELKEAACKDEDFFKKNEKI